MTYEEAHALRMRRIHLGCKWKWGTVQHPCDWDLLEYLWPSMMAMERLKKLAMAEAERMGA